LIITRKRKSQKFIVKISFKFILQLVENSNCSRLSKEIAEKSHQLRQMRGEDLEGLNVEQLQQLERSLEIGLGRVIENKVLSLATIIN
jgi:hypothetical protein